VEKPYQKLSDEGLAKQYEAGLVTTDEFCSRVRRSLGISLTDGQILDAWNTLIADFPVRHIELLKHLKNEYKTFVLSNSDETNAAYFKAYMKQCAGFDILNDCFDDVFFSCDLHDRKPSPAVFQHIIDKHRLVPSETLVIDDCRAHCESAAATGMHTHWLQPDEDICDLPYFNFQFSTF
jgi:putative hydrolase of the HAD superfamily